MNDVSFCSFIPSCLEDLSRYESCLSATELSYAKKTIQAIAILFNKREDICSLLDERARNQKITDLTGLIAEPGLIPGSDRKTIEQSIISRVNLLKKAFIYDKERDETFLLYKRGFIGPPCFNGRVITLQHYVFKRQGEKTDLFYEYSTEWDEQAVELEEVMYRCSDYFKFPDNVLPSLDQINRYLQEVKEFPPALSFSLKSDNIHAIYARASEFYGV